MLKLCMQSKLVGRNKSDFSSSRFQKNTTASPKTKGKGLGWSRDDDENEVGEASDHEVTCSSKSYFFCSCIYHLM